MYRLEAIQAAQGYSFGDSGKNCWLARSAMPRCLRGFVVDLIWYHLFWSELSYEYKTPARFEVTYQGLYAQLQRQQPAAVALYALAPGCCCECGCQISTQSFDSKLQVGSADSKTQVVDACLVCSSNIRRETCFWPENHPGLILTSHV